MCHPEFAGERIATLKICSRSGRQTVYNRAVRQNFLIAAVLILTVNAGVMAQQQPQTSQPKVQVNYLNVCAPSDDDRQQIAAALERIAGHPRFSEDFEVARGRSTLSQAELVLSGADDASTSGKPSVSNWIRIRREFPPSSHFSNAQYSFSMSERRVVETLTFRAREAKDLMQVSISDSVSSADVPAQVARMNTPAERIRLERFGKPSIVLASCPGTDQSQFDSLFKHASGIMADYRASLRVASIVPAEIARLPKASAGSATTKKRASTK